MRGGERDILALTEHLLLDDVDGQLVSEDVGGSGDHAAPVELGHGGGLAEGGHEGLLSVDNLVHEQSSREIPGGRRCPWGGRGRL